MPSRQGDDPFSRTKCPTCARPLLLPETEQRPDGTVSKIIAACPNGHRFLAQQHDWSHNQGHWYTGTLIPEDTPACT